MAIRFSSGTPARGSVSLTNGAPGPVNIPLYVMPNGAAYALKAGERFVVTSLTVSSNDTATPVITIDDGATTATVIQKLYTSGTLPPSVVTFAPGTVLGAFGIAPRATASAVTSGKTVEITVAGAIVNQA